MKFAAPAALAIALAFAGSAFAADTTAPAQAKPLTPQQQKMKDCNAQATGKTGDERKAFMSTCLKADAPAATPPAPTTQQQKMKDCNAKAGDKKGDERKTFISSCLKGNSSATAAPAH